MANEQRIRLIFLSVGLALGVAGTALAQQGIPAEQPPAGYSGDQYVDSRGCIFVRVGFGGNTEWIPRVGRDRQQLCGYRPSGAGAASASAAQAAPARSAAAAPSGGGGGASSTAGIRVLQPGDQPTPPRTTTTTAPASPATTTTRTVTVPRPATTTTTTTTTRVAPAAPAATPPAPSAPAAAPPEPPRTSCPGLTGLTGQYLSGPGVRCGPQSVHPGDAARGIVRQGAMLDSSSFSQPMAPTIPEGYVAAWDDGRLNPLRGQGTYAGRAEMALVWTDTVPRRLVSAETGHDVTHLYAGLAYPHTSYAAQQAALQTTTSTRSAVPRARTVTSRAPDPVAAPAPETGSAETIRVSSSHRHVLAGTYAARPEADRAYARLSAAGLPARLGQIERASGTVFVVVAGPYGSTDALVDGLRATRSAGFAGATTRR